MDDYEKKKFVAKAENLTVGQLLDVWAEEELKTGTLSNGTVENYLGTIRNIKKHPLAERKLKNVCFTACFLSCGGMDEKLPNHSENNRANILKCGLGFRPNESSSLPTQKLMSPPAFSGEK